MAVAWLFYVIDPYFVLGFFGGPYMLLLLISAFGVFNSLPVNRRVYIFPFLHFVKNFFGMTFALLEPIGFLLLTSQLVTQMTVYVVHRSGGNPGGFNRQSQRALVFVIVGLAYFLNPSDWQLTVDSGIYDPSDWLGNPVWTTHPTLQVSLILLWMAFRIVQRAYGRGIVGIMRAAFARLRPAR